MYSRRALLTTGVTVPGLLRAQSGISPFRVAVIGVGNRGSFLLQQLLKVPGVTITAVCDIDPKRLATAGSTISSAASYGDFRKLLENHRDFDGVIIATPGDTHKMIAIAALETGKHVYCEKPLATTVEDTNLILAAKRSAKGIFQAGFNLRHDPYRRASIDFIHRGKLGDILFLQGYRHSGDMPRQTAWYFDRVRSGDNIVEQACHILDLFTWAIGKPPLWAFGSGGINLYRNQPPGRTTMDNYVLLYEFPGNVRLEFSHIHFDPPRFSGIHERVYGSAGAIDLATATVYPRDPADPENKTELQPIRLDVPNRDQTGDYLSIADFIDNARNHKTPLNSAESARVSTLVALMGRKAIYERRVVTWTEVHGTGL